MVSGSYGDKKGTSWLMYGSGKKEGDRGLEEGRDGVMEMEEGVRMQEWPRRRESSDWKMAMG